MDRALMAEPAGAAAVVNGEHNEICHQIRDGHKFAAPQGPLSKRDVVIVGGGISGLSAAWFLRDMNFLLIEKEPHWGGNAYLEEYDGQAFATGSAYTNPDTEASELCKDLKIEPLPVNDLDGILVKREFVPDMWRSGLRHLPYRNAVRASFQKFRNDMANLDLKKRESELDSTPLSEILKDYAPELTAWWDAYGPSNWGARSADTSALVALEEFSDLAGDAPDDRITFPGGLGAISKRLGELLEASHKEHLLSGGTVIAVEQSKNDASVIYVHEGQIKQVRAKAVIVAAPKYIARHLVAGLPAAQSEAMGKIRYAPYPVVNMIFPKPVFNAGYDTWCPGNSFTDVVVADWVVHNQPGYKQRNNILSFYTPLREAERAKLLTEDGCRQIAAAVLRDWEKLSPTQGVDPLEVHIYRRGHPMFMPTPGNSTKIAPLVRQPFGRVFFANTDSEGGVSLTANSIQAARRSISEMKRVLSGAA